MSKILVTGSDTGLGMLLTHRLEDDGHIVFPFDIKRGLDVRNPDLGAIPQELDVLINCAGVNRINWLADVEDDEWDEVMDVNAKGIFKMSQACAPILREQEGTILNIVSGAARMPMRASAAYNASKGAALTLTRQLARELAPDITVFSISPNKLAATGMSASIDEQVCRVRGWSREQARQYQLAGLLTGEETCPETLAEFIGFLLESKQRHKFLAGCDLPYGL